VRPVNGAVTFVYSRSSSASRMRDCASSIAAWAACCSETR
jgi:hypothetical protein